MKFSWLWYFVFWIAVLVISLSSMFFSASINPGLSDFVYPLALAALVIGFFVYIFKRFGWKIGIAVLIPYLLIGWYITGPHINVIGPDTNQGSDLFSTIFVMGGWPVVVGLKIAYETLFKASSHD